jgi:predicted dehydrogenase
MKTVVVGLGPHGRRVVQAVRQIEKLELVGIVDLSQDALDAADVPNSVKKYLSMDALIGDLEIDVCCIATTGPSHRSLVEQAKDSGAKYLMLEKPMGCSLAECDEFEELTAAAGIRVAVNHWRRYQPYYRWLRDKFASGEWGEIRGLYFQCPGIGLGCKAIHWFDLMTFLVGRAPTRVTGWVDAPIGNNPRGAQFIDPGGLVVMEFGDSCRAVIQQVEDGVGPLCMEATLTAGRVRADEKLNLSEIIVTDPNFKPTPGKYREYTHIELPEGLSVKGDIIEMTQAVIEDLISGDLICSDAKAGMQSVEVLVAAYLSSNNENRPVNLPVESTEGRSLWLPVT